MLKVENISLEIQRRRILNKVSFEALPGELIVILGANGAGKSTLLKVICGEIKQNTGTVSYESIPKQSVGGLLSKVKQHLGFSHTSSDIAKQRAVLSQSSALNLPFLIEEVVMMGRYPHFSVEPGTIDHKIVDVTIQQTGIEKLRGRIYTTLSGGEQQRVHLARVLAQISEPGMKDGAGFQETKYLFLDEPTSSLDLKYQHQTLELAKKAAKKGAVVVAVLHDLNLAAMYADKLIMLKKGNVVAGGSTEDVLTEENIYAGYGMPVKVIRHNDYDHLIVMPLSMNSSVMEKVQLRHIVN